MNKKLFGMMTILWLCSSFSFAAEEMRKEWKGILWSIEGIFRGHAIALESLPLRSYEPPETVLNLEESRTVSTILQDFKWMLETEIAISALPIAPPVFLGAFCNGLGSMISKAAQLVPTTVPGCPPGLVGLGDYRTRLCTLPGISKTCLQYIEKTWGLTDYARFVPNCAPNLPSELINQAITVVEPIDVDATIGIYSSVAVGWLGYGASAFGGCCIALGSVGAAYCVYLFHNLKIIAHKEYFPDEDIRQRVYAIMASAYPEHSRTISAIFQLLVFKDKGYNQLYNTKNRAHSSFGYFYAREKQPCKENDKIS